MLTYADVCCRYWTYDAGQRHTDPNKQLKRIAERAERKELKKKLKAKYEARGIARILLTYADVCWRMLAHAGVCWRMLAYADVC